MQRSYRTIVLSIIASLVITGLLVLPSHVVGQSAWADRPSKLQLASRLDICITELANPQYSPGSCSGSYDDLAPPPNGVKRLYYEIFVVPRSGFRGKVKLSVISSDGYPLKDVGIRYDFANPTLSIDGGKPAHTVLTVTGNRFVKRDYVQFTVHADGEGDSCDDVTLSVFAPPDNNHTSLYVREPNIELGVVANDSTAHVELHFPPTQSPIVQLRQVQDPSNPINAFVDYKFSKTVLTAADRRCDIEFSLRPGAPHKTWHVWVEGTTQTGRRVKTQIDVNYPTIVPV